ncbi:MAG: hypothetical protein GEU94_09435 [Micromonosporaceae bacterium]|nr:hypothetical protein [Micromonosporaceae bacterium]
MAGIDEVLERLVHEPGFRTRLTSRPWAALAGYELSDKERELLAVELLAGGGAHRGRLAELDR